MPLSPEEIAHQHDLLATHRRTAKHLVAQAAQFGGEVFAPAHTVNGLAEARREIERIKSVLRGEGVQVEDDPNDESPPPREPVQRAAGDVVMGDIVGGDKRTTNTEGGDYAEGYIDKRQDTFIGQQTNYYQPVVTPLDRQHQRNRRAMLQKVKAIWIEGLLEQSLAKELRIVLDLAEKPDAVDLPLNALVQELQRAPRALPVGTPIIDVFDKMGGALLILGAPGAGKTTLLLELTRDLIVRAEQDEGHPIPVVFNLSSWAEKRQPLKEWLVEELNTKYDVPRKMAQEWINADVVLPLLDGLDEVAVGHRSNCVEAINTYRQEHGLVPLAVCSRVADYEALATKLRLQGAIIIQVLTNQQVDAYLKCAGEKLVGVRVALHDDKELGEMLNTPLMLSIVALAYAEKSAAEIQDEGTSDVRHRHLFDAYIAAMFKRRSKGTHYTPQQSLPWLSWLAQQLVADSQTVFYIERIQPDSLSTYVQRLLFGGSVGLATILALGIAWSLVEWQTDFMAGIPLASLSIALIFGLGAGLAQEVVRVELLRWSGSSVLFFCLVLTLGFLGLVARLMLEPFKELPEWVWAVWTIGIVVGAAVILTIGWRGREIETRTAPNQGIIQSAKNVIKTLLLVMAVTELAFGLIGRWSEGLFFGLALGLTVGLFKGSIGCVQHYTLRLLLYRNGSLPFRLVPFLDYCTERIFLRKVGGGYIFVHRLLMEHFASLYTEGKPAEPVEAQRTTS